MDMLEYSCSHIFFTASIVDSEDTHLYDATSIEYSVSNRLESFHLIKGFDNFRVLNVNQSESSDVDGIVLEIFQVERVEILERYKSNALHYRLTHIVAGNRR